jgi:hypothetical protein
MLRREVLGIACQQKNGKSERVMRFRLKDTNDSLECYKVKTLEYSSVFY